MAYEHVVDRERCKGCGLCVGVCPKGVLEMDGEMNARGYFPVYQARPEDCVFCAICCTMCPEVAMVVNEIGEQGAGRGGRRK